MTKRITLNIVCLLLAGSVAGFVAGCKSGSHAKKSATPTAPTSHYGTLLFPVAGTLNNPQNTGCFPVSQGWDKYMIITNYFVGPNYTTPCNACFANDSHYANVMVSTCNSSNGTQLQTGIQIQYEYGPQDKVCATNTPSCIDSPLLTIDQRSMVGTRRYRATIFYKSATAAGLPKIVVDWKYLP
jgi:hypothetical protein